MTTPTPQEIEVKARELIELRGKATSGGWDTLDEQREIHALDWIDGTGDPLHICMEVNNERNTNFIVHAANHASQIAQAYLKERERNAELLGLVNLAELILTLTHPELEKVEMNTLTTRQYIGWLQAFRNALEAEKVGG
jgi:hypothetical protein